MTANDIAPSRAQQDPRRFSFPPAIPVARLLASWGMGYVWPLHITWPAWAFWAGLALFTLPHALAAWVRHTFRRHHTGVAPRGDVVEIVSGGPFEYTRNPMYLTLIILYIGATLLFRLAWAPLLLIPVFLTLHFAVIRPEEQYLESKFGEDYVRYRQRVRRWL